MTVNVVDTINSRIVYYYYTTGDTLPTPAVTDPKKEHIAICRDDGKKYQWNGTQWKEHASGGGGGELPTGWYISEIKKDSRDFIGNIYFSECTVIWSKMDGTKETVTAVPDMSVGERLTAIKSGAQLYEWLCIATPSSTRKTLAIMHVKDLFAQLRIIVPAAYARDVTVGQTYLTVDATGYILTAFQA